MAKKKTKKVSEEIPLKSPAEFTAEELADNASVSKLFRLVTWLTGVIVSLSVGFGMIGETLSLPIWLGGVIVSKIAGWVVVVTTLLGVVLAIFNK